MMNLFGGATLRRRRSASMSRDRSRAMPPRAEKPNRRFATAETCEPSESQKSPSIRVLEAINKDEALSSYVVFRDTDVADLLNSKEIRKVHSIREDSIVYDAIARMVKCNIGALVVVREDGTLSGIFSERDYMSKVILRGLSSRKTYVREIMTSNPITVMPKAELRECMSLMTTNRFRHLPVVQQGKVVGLVSIGDVVKHVLEEQQQMIRFLRGFVEGQYSK